jgi:hypothetical protein
VEMKLEKLEKEKRDFEMISMGFIAAFVRLMD